MTSLTLNKSIIAIQVVYQAYRYLLFAYKFGMQLRVAVVEMHIFFEWACVQIKSQSRGFDILRYFIMTSRMDLMIVSLEAISG